MFADELLEHIDEKGVPRREAADEPDWTTAACRRRPGSAELFFSEQIPEINEAKALCGTCPLLEPCLAGAIIRREPAGVWGGQLFVNGHILAQKRRRGRPPKVRAPEPELVLPAAITRLIAELDRDSDREAQIA